MLKEAAQAGYRSIELGPWGYLPTDPASLRAALEQHQLSLVAGTIFDDLVSEAHFPTLVALTHQICRNLSQVAAAEPIPGRPFQPPYLVIIDFGNPERARFAGRGALAPRLNDKDWQRMMEHIIALSTLAWQEYGVRAVIHPHAGGSIEFADEIERLANDIPHNVAGLCLDTGHLYYAGMDPLDWLDRYYHRLDYLHFKDVDPQVYQRAIHEGIDFFTACAAGVMCPLGSGAIDYPAIKDFLARRGYQGWITIEQERDPRHAAGSLQAVWKVCAICATSDSDRRHDMINGLKPLDRTLRWGMVGGGGSSQIGYIHRSAALRDNTFTLLAGAFDIDGERGRQFGQRLGVDPDRCYADYQSLFRGEAARPDGIQAVSVATPNNTHYAICRAALEAGLHVVCEKPLCFSSEEADELVALSQRRRKIIGVTYGYAGHQLILQARQMIADGLLGDIRIVNMQFAHGFHAQPVEQENASTRWRVDPRFVGPSYVLGDLATHPLFLVETMAPQLKITRLMCARQSFVKSRAPLEDNAHVLMEYDNGAIGSLWSSAVNCGSMHGQKVRIIGEKASLEWWDEQPNQLRYEIQGEPVRILERGMDYLDPLARQDDRIGGGHPEGLFEAWSNLYRRFAIAMDAADRRDEALLADFWYPDARAGAFGVRWVENCVRSADNGACWVDFR